MKEEDREWVQMNMLWFSHARHRFGSDTRKMHHFLEAIARDYVLMDDQKNKFRFARGWLQLQFDRHPAIDDWVASLMSMKPPEPTFERWSPQRIYNDFGIGI